MRVWQYEVRAGREAEFERVYADDGPWAHLFARSDGFLGTELFRSVAGPRTFLTVDRFARVEDFTWVLAQHGDSYAELDDMAATLTSSEQEIATVTRP
ncbi:MAG: antibiotic biosynthesis monooxygenase [Dermatophilaceae bacterium]